MSKEYFIITILNENSFNGTIDQTLYDFIVKRVSEAFKVKQSIARQTVTRVLRELFN